MKDFNFNPFDFLKLLKLSFKPIDDKVGPQDNPPPPNDFLFEQEDKYDVDQFITKYGFPDAPDVMVAKYALPDDNPDIQVEKYALPDDDPDVMVAKYALPDDDPDVMVAKYALPDEPDVEIVMYALPPDGPQPPIVEPKPTPQEIQPMTTTEFFKLLDPDGKGEIVAEDVIKIYNETTDANLKAILSYFTDGTEVTDAFKLACSGVMYDSYEDWNKGITNGTDDPDMIAQNGIISADSLARLAELAKNPSTDAVLKHLDTNRTEELKNEPIIMDTVSWMNDDEKKELSKFLEENQIEKLYNSGVSGESLKKILEEQFPGANGIITFNLRKGAGARFAEDEVNLASKLEDAVNALYGEDSPYNPKNYPAPGTEEPQMVPGIEEPETVPATEETKTAPITEETKAVPEEKKADDIDRPSKNSIYQDLLARMRKMLDRLFSEE